MGVIFQPGYALPPSDYPLTHSRILHARIWATGTPDVSSTEAGYFADAPQNALTYEKWKPSSVPAYWQVDYAAPEMIDCICIGAHTLGTSGCSFVAQYWDGADWVDLTYSTAPSDDSDIMIIFAPVITDAVKIDITAGDEPVLGVVFAGKALQMPRPFFAGHAPLVTGRRTVVRTNRSETGETQGRTIQRVDLVGSFAWEHLPDDFVRNQFAEFQKAIESEAFFIAWRPGEYSECHLCSAEEGPIPENMGVRALMSSGSIPVRARAHD